MADHIQIFPYMSTPNGITVCYSRNGGAVEQRRFPAGTTREEILASLAGTPPPPKPDLAAEEKARAEEERQKRAAASQAPETKTEEQIKTEDTERDKKILDMNYMRSKLKEAHVKGYQLLKGDALKKKYEEKVADGTIKED